MHSWKATTILTLALALCHFAPAAAQTDTDETKADPAHHKVVFENDQVRVVRWVILPGDKTAQHSHPNMVSVSLTEMNGRITTADGKTSPMQGKAGAVAWRTPTTHVVENLGKQPMMGILIEPKKPSSSLPAGAQDVGKVDPAHTKVEFENDQVRVIRFHFAPGETSPMHGHPDNVQVLLTDAATRATFPDGTTKALVGKAGDATWRPAAQHSIQNGAQPVEGILVEMKGTQP